MAMRKSTGSKRSRLRLAVVLSVLAVGIVVALASSAFGAELVTAEVTGTTNNVTVTQGSSTTSTIDLTATGSIACTTTSSNPATATVDTSYSLDSLGALTSSSPSSAKNFFSNGSANGGGGNCGTTWTGAPTAYTVTATFSADAATPVGNYNVILSSIAGTTAETNPNTTNAKLTDSTATTVVVHVVGGATNHAPSTPGVPTVASGTSPRADGNFTVNWAASTDQDAGDSVTYTLWQHDSSTPTPTWSQVASGLTSNSYTFGGSNTAESEGTWSYRVQSADNHGATSNFSETDNLVVIDESNPNAPTGNTTPAAAYNDTTYNWYKDSVQVSFTDNGDAALADGSAGSGVASVSSPQTFDSTNVNATTGYFTTTGTATDNVGNVSAGTTVEGKVDWQSPTVSITPSTPPVYTDGSGNHWWKGSFSYDVTASDPAPSSGLASDPTTTGVGPTTTSGTVAAGAYTATDNVGHSGSNSAFAYNVDATAPHVDCTVPDTTIWYGSDQTVTCTASDADSGLADSADASFSLSTNVSTGTETSSATTGSKTVTDNVGNSTTVGPYTFMIDKKAPQLSGNCDSPDGQWHASDVTLNCTYTDGGSGPASQQVGLSTNVATGTETADAIASANGAQACDAVHNCADSPSDIGGNMIDKKAPVISDLGTTDAPTGMVGSTFWWNHDVTVNFSATDGGSGVACTTPWTELTTGEGNDVTVSSGPCADRVGNANNAITSSGYHIDKTPPSVTCGTPPAFLLNQTNTQVSASVGDTGSGPAATTASSTADTSSPGMHSVLVTGYDNAGNAGTASCSYTVNYGLGNGFLPPLNPDDTGSVLNIGNAGRTYPIKWQLTDANGNYVTNAVSGTTITVSKVACTAFSSDTGDPIDTTTSGATVLRYDTTSNQYIYNWATPTTKSTCYRMTVSLPSGQKMIAAFQMK